MGKLDAALRKRGRLQIPDALGRRKQVEHGLGHALPREFFLEVPVSVNHTIVRLQVPVKSAMIEDAVDRAVETMDSRVILIELGACEGLPKLHLPLSRVRPGRFGQDPGVRAF